MLRTKATSERVSAMRKRIFRFLKKMPRKPYWCHDLYFQFRNNRNVFVVYQALLSIQRSRLVKISYLRRGNQVMYGIPALTLKN